ncbi:MAG TPA: hypothetical protein VF743_05435 [Acidimicrobiales bacterium]
MTTVPHGGTTDVRRRWRATRHAAEALCARSLDLQTAARSATARAEALRTSGQARRSLARSAGSGHLSPAPARWGSDFTVEGLVDGEVVRARWTVAGGLAAPDELVRRAEIVVALGETFSVEEGGDEVLAELDGHSMAALLTVVRAFTAVRSIRMATRAGGPARG